MNERAVVVASNRGPVTFIEEDGVLVPRRGAGGLVSALSTVVQESGGRWVASAMSELDRRQAASVPDGRTSVILDDAKFDIRLLAFDPIDYDLAYNEISNRILWFLHHAMWDVPQAPMIDTPAHRAWQAYRGLNDSFAAALAEEVRGRQASVLVQDYHLSLVPSRLRAAAPGVRIAHFHHCPFAGPEYFELLPGWMRGELMAGLLGADVLGFQSRRWAERFLGCAARMDGVRVEGPETIRWNDRTVRVGVYPISTDPAALEEAAASPEVAARGRELERWLGGRKLLLRVDRAEPTKNIQRGLMAYRELLERFPSWQGRVVFLALLNPSRRGLPEYREYTTRCLEIARRINAELGEPGWVPVEVRVSDDYDEVLAAFRIHDALLVNPVLDGMNLVAKEGSLLNERDGVLLLSRGAGAFDELGAHALPVEPLDVAGTADAINRALSMPPAERATRAKGLRDVCSRRTPAGWVGAQLADLADL